MDSGEESDTEEELINEFNSLIVDTNADECDTGTVNGIRMSKSVEMIMEDGDIEDEAYKCWVGVQKYANDNSWLVLDKMHFKQFFDTFFIHPL